MKKYKYILKPLTAVHIGTGDVVTPLEYGVGKIQKEDSIFYYSNEKILQLLKEEELKEFNNVIKNNNIIEIRNFFKKYSKKYINECITYFGHISEEFKQEYDARFNDHNNSLEIETIYKVNKNVIVPGSSIKGAIRTAILNYYADMKNVNNIANNRLQKYLLNYTDPKNDPFRLISIRDTTFDIRNNLLVSLMEVVHYNSFQSPKGIAIYIEALKGLLLDAESHGEGEITIHDELINKKVENRNEIFFIKNNDIFDIEKLFNQVNWFYLNVFNDEYNKVQNSNMPDVIKNVYEQLADYIDTTAKANNEILIRIGRWSHIESVTIEKCRRPSNRRGFGKTRSFIKYNNTLYPMGWCLLHRL